MEMIAVWTERDEGLEAHETLSKSLNGVLDEHTGNTVWFSGFAAFSQSMIQLSFYFPTEESVPPGDVDALVLLCLLVIRIFLFCLFCFFLKRRSASDTMEAALYKLVYLKHFRGADGIKRAVFVNSVGHV